MLQVLPQLLVSLSCLMQIAFSATWDHGELDLTYQAYASGVQQEIAEESPQQYFQDMTIDVEQGELGDEVQHLSGSKLVEAFQNTRQATKKDLQDIVAQRINLLHEAGNILDDLRSMRTDLNNIDFTTCALAWPESQFLNYGTYHSWLVSRERWVDRLYVQVTDLVEQATQNRANVGRSNVRKVIEFSRDVYQISSWTHPQSLNDLHNVIMRHDRDQDVLDYIREEKRKAMTIADHLQTHT